MSSSRRTWALRSGLVLASTLAVIALLEVGLRLTGFEYHLYPYTIEFGYPDPETIESEFTVHDELLWVWPYYDEQIERALTRETDVVFMGCSCTAWGGYVKEFRKLAKLGNPELDTVYENLAVPGWTSYQGLRQLETDVLAIGPKLVTIFYGWNDHWAGYGVEDKDAAPLISSMYGSPLYRNRDLRLVQLLSKIKLSIASSGAVSRPERVSEQDFRANLVAMVELCERNGITPVLLTAPTSHLEGSEPAALATRSLRQLGDLVPLHQRYVSIVREVAAERGVVLCDLAHSFDELPRPEVEEAFSEDGIHFTRKGGKTVARLLHECFVEHALYDLLE